MRIVTAVLGVLLWTAGAGRADGMEVRLGEIRTVGPTLRVSVELHQTLSEKFLALLAAGETLHVRVQAEVWEDRPLWDKLAHPAIVSAFRILREADGQITVVDLFGIVASLRDAAAPVPLRIEAAPVSTVSDAARYYLRLVATVGTIETKEAADTGEAVFGRDDSTISVARVGKLIFNTVVQVTDYLQSVSAETRSAIFSGKELKAGIRKP